MSSTAKQQQREAALDAVFSALSDTTRRRILSELKAGPRLVGELAEPFSMSLPAVCKHLDVLERAGLLRREREGRVSRCFLETRALETAGAFIEHQRAFWSETLDSLAEYVEQPAARRSKVRSND